MLHACLAQIYVCTLFAIALALSGTWINGATQEREAPLVHFGRWCCGLLLVQLAIAAVMRHSYAGMAIPTFPLSSAEGDILPTFWNFRVSIHFAHRVMAVVLSVALIAYVVKLWKARLSLPAITIVVLLCTQVALGAYVIWSSRNPYVTTGHVLGGALLLATTFGATMWTSRREGAVTA